MMSAVLIVATAILVVVPFIFICHKVYQDGVIGRFILGAIVVFSGMILAEEIQYTGRYDTYPEIVWLIVSFAGFIVWHLVRFHRRVLSAKRAISGEIDRRKSEPGDPPA